MFVLMTKIFAMKFTFRKIALFCLFTISLWACKEDDSESMVEDPTAENKKALGLSAEDILSNDIYTSLTVEMAFTAEYAPTQQTINAFKQFILERVNKSSGVVFIENQVSPPGNDPFSIDEIRDIEDDIRTQYTEGNNIAIFVFFANGNSTNDTQNTVTLGTAYRNTSIVIYERTIQEVTDSDPEILPLLETTTLNHEFGHILGLTNIQNDDIHQNHEDGDNLKHCMVENCLMYYDATNVTREMIYRLSSRMAVPELDALCIEDLQAKGGK